MNFDCSHFSKHFALVEIQQFVLYRTIFSLAFVLRLYLPPPPSCGDRSSPRSSFHFPRFLSSSFSIRLSQFRYIHFRFDSLGKIFFVRISSTHASIMCVRIVYEETQCIREVRKINSKPNAYIISGIHQYHRK